MKTAALLSATWEHTVWHVLSAQHTQFADEHAPVVHAPPQSLPPEAVQQPHWLYPVHVLELVHEFQWLHASVVPVPPLPESAQRLVWSAFSHYLEVYPPNM